MAYNPYSAVNAIYNLKGQWDNANNANDAEKKNQAAARAQAYYNQLRNNGYANIADELSASNYAQAKSTRDKWAKMGKTATRPHLYTLGKKYGMSQNDVDKLIGWDDSTGQISFGGKNIGTPDTVVDGTSYWSDTSTLDNAFRDYITRSGTTIPSGVNNAAYNQRMQSAGNKNDGLYSEILKDKDKIGNMYQGVFDYANSDVTKSDEYKSAFEKVMPEYLLNAMQGRDNAVASSAGSNGGNIDSFAAANALRQQAALTAKGQSLAHQMGLEAYQARIQHAKDILSNLGVYNDSVYGKIDKTIQNDSSLAQQYFDNDETAKNNDTTRKSTMASVSGYTPSDWTIQNDAFLKNFVDDNGKLKSEYYNTDFQDLINKAKASGNADLANKYAILRGLKIFGDFTNYGKYLNEGDVSYVKPNRTADYDLTKQQIDSAERISKANNETSLAAANAEFASNERIADKVAQNKLDQLEYAAKYNATEPKLTAAQAISAIKNGEKSQSVIDAYNYWYNTNYTVDNPPKVNSSGNSKSSGGTNTPLSDSEVKAWVKFLNDDISSRYGDNAKALKEVNKGQYQRADADADYIIIKVFGSDELTQEQKEYLLYDKFGITEDQVNAAIKDPHYR